MKGPLAQMLRGARIIMASTPEYGDSPCKGIIEGIDPETGLPIASYVNFQFTCDKCLEIQRKAQAASYLCTHRMWWRPPFQNPRVMKILEIAYGEAGKEQYNRENNITPQTINPAMILMKARALELGWMSPSLASNWNSKVLPTSLAPTICSWKTFVSMLKPLP